MSVPEIVDKLAEFLDRRDSFTEECEVVYFMVEARKLIDQQKLSLPILKFYADWCVHSSKDVITPEIKAMSEQMYAGAVARINNPNSPEDHTSPISDFVYMVNLHTEIDDLLTQYGLSNDFTQVKERWVSFIGMLVKVLENQPINNPSIHVQTILFEPAAEGCVIGTIVFRQPVESYPHFTLKNAY